MFLHKLFETDSSETYLKLTKYYKIDLEKLISFHEKYFLAKKQQQLKVLG